MRVTPEVIKQIDKTKEVFVFGSNENGIHGAGAAKIAYEKFGATIGQGFGPSGATFAIPTKDWDIQTLDYEIVKFYVKRFIAYAKNDMVRKLTFYVTPIGCGLAGFKPEQIAPLFAECLEMKNVYLPQLFIDVLKNNKVCVS